MVRSKELLVIPEPFVDILSGEFAPYYERKGRTHTLGRLALATFEKGFSGVPEAEGGNISYRPSWAKGVSSSLGRIMLPDGKSKAFEVSLRADNDEDEMSFIDIEGKQLLVYEASRNHGRFEFTYDYENHFDELQAMVAERAKLFLDKMAE